MALPMTLRLILPGFALVFSLSACGGAKLLREPLPLKTPNRPLAEAVDNNIETALDWVIVRDGPGTWAKNADWDEYLIRVRNLTERPLTINKISTTDSSSTTMNSSSNRRSLVRASRQTAKRYKQQGLTVNAGLGGATLAATGGAALATGSALLVSAVATSSTATAVVAAGTLVSGPVLALGGAMRAVNNTRVAREIILRHTPLPLELAAAKTATLNVFFPLAPSPQALEFEYTDSTGTSRVLSMTALAHLAGLHLENVPTAPPTDDAKQ